MVFRFHAHERHAQEVAAEKFRYVMWGSLDDPEQVPPQGEFFCKDRPGWMPEISGVFHKQEIKQ
jgi:hypothetical protein